MGQGYPRKANGLRMPKKWAKGAYKQCNRSIKPKSSMSISPMAKLRHCNQWKEEYIVGPREA